MLTNILICIAFGIAGYLVRCVPEIIEARKELNFYKRIFEKKKRKDV